MSNIDRAEKENSHKFSFEPLSRSDFPLLSKWLSEPHVQRWWDESPDQEEVERKYAPRVEGTDPTRVYIASLEQPAGMIQVYKLRHESEEAERLGVAETAIGVDLLIGEKSAIVKGNGTKLLRTFCEKVIPRDFPEASLVVADPSAGNHASIRAFEKAGFHKERVVEGEDGKIQVMVLDR